MTKRHTMLKHSYHARLSIWHVVLLVIVLAISLPVIAEPVFSSPQLSQLKTPWQLAEDNRLALAASRDLPRAGDRLR